MGIFKILSLILYQVRLLLSAIPALHSSVSCPKTFPSPPLFFPELRSSPWEVIYNAIGLTIIRLHTISPRPRSPGRLLRSTFLFAQKHIVHPCSQDVQGRSRASETSDATSKQLDISLIFVRVNSQVRGETRADPGATFRRSADNCAQIWLSCRYISPHEMQTHFLTAHMGFFYFSLHRSCTQQTDSFFFF